MALTKVTDSIIDFDTLTIAGTQAADTTYLKLQNTPATAATHKVAMEFWGNEGTANNQTFNMGRIYGEFDGSSYSTTRLTLGSASGNGTFNDEVSLKNGNVGINDTAPGEKLSVTSADNTSSTNIARFAANNDSLAIGLGYETIRQTESAGVIKFETGGSERMKINSSGNVSIGTISPAAKFHVKGSSGAVTGVIYAQQDATGVSKPGIALSKYDNDNSTSQVYIMFGINQYNSGCGQINANGASQAAFGSFSDRRLKENITDLPSQLDNIIALQPKEFDYIESEGGGHQIGFIAQEVEEIYPDLVGERDSDNMKTLSGMGKMEARLISAIKELKTELDAAKARIETLENA